jgi:hypothetical protein
VRQAASIRLSPLRFQQKKADRSRGHSFS